MQENKERSYEEMTPTLVWDALLLLLSTALPALILCCQTVTAAWPMAGLSGGYRLALGCPNTAGKLMDAADGCNGA